MKDNLIKNGINLLVRKDYFKQGYKVIVIEKNFPEYNSPFKILSEKVKIH